MFNYLRSRAQTCFTLRQFGWFVAFNMMAIWVYHEAIFDRVFAPIAVFLRGWIRSGKILGEQEASEAGRKEDDDQT